MRVTFKSGEEEASLEVHSTSDNVIVMRNMDTKQNVISVTHNDVNTTSSMPAGAAVDVAAGAATGDNMYVITVGGTTEGETSGGTSGGDTLSSQDEAMVREDGGEDGSVYDFPGALHNVESNVSVETVVHQGVYQESVEIETDHSLSQ